MTRALAIVVAAAALMCACHDSREPRIGDKELAELEAFNNRKRYADFTPAILASIPDSDVEQAIVDYVHIKIGDDVEHERQIVAKLPIGAQALYITWSVDSETRSGGFYQYFESDSAEYADQAAEAFEFFSAHDHAALMREANSVHALDIERQRLKGQNGGFEDSQLGPLDDRFKDLKEDLSALRIAKIRSMPEFFSGK